jgi:hypothetical protein
LIINSSFPGNKSHNDPSNKGDVNKKPKPSQGRNEAKELQALAFGGATSKKKSNKKKQTNKQTAGVGQQFEEWKQKDVEVR